jgi:TonB family protein
MNSCLSFWHRHLIGHAALFLLVGWAAVAQQPSGDKSKTAIPRAGVNGISVPKCEYCPDPQYSQEARDKKYEGVVVLLVVVSSEGKASDIRMIKSPGMGLDEKAIEAVREWRFKPATKDGKAVDAQVPVEITFRRRQ